MFSALSSDYVSEFLTMATTNITQLGLFPQVTHFSFQSILPTSARVVFQNVNETRLLSAYNSALAFHCT